MSEVKVNKVSPRSGTGLQLGDSGDTITIPSGATLANAGTATGFAAIDWQSTIVTGSTHTASANQGIWINTTSNACNLTLPGSPSVGDQLIFSDFARTWASNAVTLTLNGSKYQGNTSPIPVYDTAGETVHIVYSGSTQGWIPINDGAVALETPQNYSIDFLVIAGGGGGNSGGGGAGGYRESTQTIDIGSAITVTVGDGGAGGSPSSPGSNSSVSGPSVTTITSAGGGGGGSEAGTAGGSGGGGGGVGETSPNPNAGGAGNTPSTTPSQGNDGGIGNGVPSQRTGGGGGGAGAGGANGNTSGGTVGGAGGDGTASAITGSSVTRAGGGGGGNQAPGTPGAGGAGGGGAGNRADDGVAGTANTGGGGGGVLSGGNAGAGGKGVVIISVPDGNYSGTTTGSPTVVTGVGGTKTVMTFTGSGSYTA